MLNLNARLVDDALVKQVIQDSGIPHGDIYATQSREDASTAARDIIDGGYDVVAVVGGDGTIVGAIEALADEGEKRGEGGGVKGLPVIAYLPMGTGNGLGGVVGYKVGRFKKRKR